MSADKPKGLGILAKRRTRLLQLVEAKTAAGDLVMASHYRTKAAEAQAALRAEQACLRCGRKLKDPTSQERGYGSECARFMDADPATRQGSVGEPESD